MSLSSVIGSLRVDLSLQTAQFSQGVKRVETGIKGLQTSLDRGIAGFGRLRNALAGFAAIAGLGQIIHLNDQFTDLNSRVGIAMGSMDAAGPVMERLNQIARDTYSSFATTADGFLQNVGVLRDLGMTTDQALDYTAALNNALVVSGAKGQDAERVQKALSDAMIQGKLSGDGLNAVLTRGGRVAELLAAELGTNVSGLRAMGTQGKITADVIRNALMGNMQLLADEAASMPATVGDAMVLLQNAMLQLSSSTSGAMSLLAEAIILVADNLQRLVTYAAVGAAAYGTVWVAGMVSAAIATGGLTGALTLLRAAIMRTGIGLLVVAVGELIYRFGEWADSIGGIGRAFTILGDTANSTFDWVKAGGSTMMDLLNGVSLSIQASFTGAWAAIQRGFASMMTAIQNGLNAFIGGLNDTFTFEIEVFGQTFGMEGLGINEADFADGYARVAEENTRLAEQLGDRAAEIFGNLGNRFANLETPLDTFNRLTAEAADEVAALNEEGQALNNNPVDPTSGGKSTKAVSDYSKVIKRLREDLELYKNTIGMTAIEEQIWKAQREAGVTANSAQGQLIADTIRQTEAYKDQKTAIENMKDTFQSSFASMLAGTVSLRDGFANLFKTIANNLANKAIAGLFGNLLGGLGGDSWFGKAASWMGFGANANGTTNFQHASGLSLVGERGPELVRMNQGSQVFNSQQTKSMLRGAGSGSSNITVSLSPDLIASVLSEANQGSVKIVQQGISQYDKSINGRIANYSNDPRARG